MRFRFLSVRIGDVFISAHSMSSLFVRNRQIKAREEQNEKAAKSGFSDVDIQYGISGSGDLKRSVKYFNAFKPFFSAVIASE